MSNIPQTATLIGQLYRGAVRQDCPAYRPAPSGSGLVGLCTACNPHPALARPDSGGLGPAHCETCPWHDKDGVLRRWHPTEWHPTRRRQREKRPLREPRYSSLRRWETDRERIADALAALGLGSGDVVQIHSSLGNLGHVHGGATAVVNALLDCVGRDGTVFSPAFVESAPIECGECKRQPLCPSQRPSEMGAISEEFRKRPDTLRSCDRTHPFCGIGAHARDAVAAQKDIRTPCGRGSVFQWVYELDGYFLCLGVGVNSITAFHLPEEVLAIPNLGVYDADVGRIYYTPTGKRLNYAFPRLAEELLRAAGILRTVRVGLATLHCAPARELIDFLLAALRDDPTCMHLYPTGNTDDLFPDAARKAARMLDVFLAASER